MKKYLLWNASIWNLNVEGGKNVWFSLTGKYGIFEKCKTLVQESVWEYSGLRKKYGANVEQIKIQIHDILHVSVVNSLKSSALLDM